MKIPKVSQREWIFLAAGAVLGYVVVPKILHQAGVATNTTGCPPGKCRSLGFGTGPDNPCDGNVTSGGCDFG